MTFTRLATAAIAVTALTATTLTAEADRRRYAPERNYVVAHSEFGNGKIAAPVRYTRRGRQVRLPGGSWVYCARSCSETLRVKTVDFWQSEEGAGARNAMTHDGGVFGKLGITFGW